MSLHELNIPDWAFLDGYSHEGDLLEGREVIIHTPTLTIIEFLQADNLDLYLNKGVIHQSFKCMGENLTAAVYKSLTEDVEDILKKAIEWYIAEADFMTQSEAMNN